MLVSHEMRIDLTGCGCQPVAHAVQGEANTRQLVISLFTNSVAWEIPSGATAAVAFLKPDGTKGLYDKLPDDSPATFLSGNTVTAILAPQALTCAGTVLTSIVFYDTEGDTLATFPFRLLVEKNPAGGEQISNDYYNPSIFDLDKAVRDLEEQVEELKKNGGGSGGPATPGEPGADGATFTPSVSADGTLSWNNDKGLPNPDPVNIRGPKSDDGISPEVSVTTLTHGHRITIEDAFGVKTFELMDGISPAIGRNGNWFIGDQDTGIPAQGAVGDAGRGIQSVERTSGNGAAGTVDTYTTFYTDGTTGTHQIRNGADGSQGDRGTGVLKIATATTSASGTTDDGKAIKYKIALSTVMAEAGVGEVLVGDTIARSYYQYPVIKVDSSYAYLGDYTSIRGATGAAATFTITGVESLPYGSAPTITEDSSSSSSARKYKLGIPAGEPGPAYELTPDDKTAIAAIVVEGLRKYAGEVS